MKFGIILFIFAGIVNVDKTVHDWGDVTVNDGALSCTFTVENVSEKPQTITMVTKTCGCTKVSWPLEPLAPGEKGEIKAVFDNDQGPYPFDKTLNVYFEGVKKPMILHLRGDVHSKELPVEESYPVHLDGLGLKKQKMRVGNMDQGEQISTEFRVANLTSEPMELSWAEIGVQLKLSPKTQTIAPGQVAGITAVISSNRTLWGNNIYEAYPIINGKRSNDALLFSATTRENFSGWTPEQLANAPVAVQRTIQEPEAGLAGDVLEAGFEIANKGKSTLHIYKMDYKRGELEVLESAESIPAGKSARFRFRLDTSKTDGSFDDEFVVTLYTDDPEHSIVNFYINAFIL